MERYTLNDLSVLTGINTDTIRIWEKRYGFLTPQRTSTNRRFYTSEDLKKLINVTVLYNNGYKVSKIALLSNDALSEKAHEISEVAPGMENEISRLIVAMTGLDEQTINSLLGRSFVNLGFEATFRSVIFPFLRRIGIMWHTGAAGVGEEHFVSHIIRRKLFAAIDNMIFVPSEGSKRALLFLPENEYHELSMLYYFYLLRKAGHHVLCLGQSTPFDAAVSVAGTWKPDLIITGAVSGLGIKEPESWLSLLSNTFAGVNVLIAGKIAGLAGLKDYPNIYPLISENDLWKVLK